MRLDIVPRRYYVFSPRWDHLDHLEARRPSEPVPGYMRQVTGDAVRGMFRNAAGLAGDDQDIPRRPS